MTGTEFQRRLEALIAAHKEAMGRAEEAGEEVAIFLRETRGQIDSETRDAVWKRICNHEAPPETVH